MSIFTDSLNKETAIWFEYFTKGFRGLMPNDKDIFLQKFLEEQEEARKIAMLEEIAQEKLKLDDMNTSDFIKAMQDEVQDLAKENTQEQTTTQENTKQNNQNEQQDSLDSNQNTEQNTQKETKQITQPNEAQDNHSTSTISEQEAKQIIEKHQQNIANVINPQNQQNLTNAIKEPDISYDDFKMNVLYPQQAEFIKANRQELLDSQILSVMDIGGGNKTDIYDNEIVTPKEQVQQMYEDYLKSPNRNEWSANFNLSEIKQRRVDDNEFLNTFKQEAQSCITLEDTKAKSLEEYKKNLNPDTYFADMSDWFREKQRENANMPMSKEVFKQEFYKYCKNGMTENEMKILLILDNKNPSKLTKEHKDMIKEGLKLCTTNNKLLDNGLHTAIEASLILIDKDIKLTNNKVLDFAKTIEKMEKSNNPIDKKFLESGAAQKIIDKIKDTEKTPNLRKEMAERMDKALENALKAHSNKITIENKEHLESKGYVFDEKQNAQINTQTNAKPTPQNAQDIGQTNPQVNTQIQQQTTMPQQAQQQTQQESKTQTTQQTQTKTPPTPQKSRGRGR